MKNCIIAVLAAGLLAAAGCANDSAQAWEVRIIDSKEWIDGITEVYKAANPQMASRPGFKNMFVNAPAVIAVGYPDETPDARPRDLSKISFVK